MINRIRKAMDEKDQGFTLIELLVVIIIIGILAAIAIPVFLNQRKKGVDAGVKADLKNAATAAETLATDSPSGAATSTTPFYTAGASGNVGTAGFKKSPNNTVEIAGSPAAGYCIRGSNAGSTGGTGSYLFYDSQNGGLSNTAFSATPGSTLTTCASAAVTAAGGWVSVG